MFHNPQADTNLFEDEAFRRAYNQTMRLREEELINIRAQEDIARANADIRQDAVLQAVRPYLPPFGFAMIDPEYDRVVISSFKPRYLSENARLNKRAAFWQGLALVGWGLFAAALYVIARMMEGGV